MQSITSALGAGSGIDTAALIQSLTAATRAPQQAIIERRTELNNSRISTIATVSASVDSFASALQDLINGGSLRKTTSVSDPSVLSATVVAGSRPTAGSNRLTVDAVATGQTLVSGYLAGPDTAVGTGEFTIATASGSVSVQIDAGNNSLAGLVAAINGSSSAVKASVVTDADGARMVLQGPTGAANAFSVSTTSTDGLERFAFGTGIVSDMQATQAAGDAMVKIDGVTTRHASNIIKDLVNGVEINLISAKPGSTVALTLSNPTANIESAVRDFVDAFNQVRQQLDAAVSPVGGPLRGNEAMVGLQRSLAKLTTTPLISASNGPTTLSEIGVRTNRDGSLSVDVARLSSVLASNPDGVEALFNPAQFSSSPDVIIKSAPGRVRPGTYTLTNLQPQNGTAPASGLIDGLPATGIGRNLVAPPGSTALGLIVGVNASVASATVTIEPGLGGVLDTIRDALRSSSGPLAATRQRLAAEAKTISADQEKLDARMQRYTDQLTRSYASVDSRVAAFRATQSYLTQQISIWTNANK